LTEKNRNFGLPTSFDLGYQENSQKADKPRNFRFPDIRKMRKVNFFLFKMKNDVNKKKNKKKNYFLKERKKKQLTL